MLSSVKVKAGGGINEPLVTTVSNPLQKEDIEIGNKLNHDQHHIADTLTHNHHNSNHKVVKNAPGVMGIDDEDSTGGYSGGTTIANTQSPSRRNNRLLSSEILLNETDDEHAERLKRLSRNSTFIPVLPKNNKYLTTFMLLNYMIGAGILNQPYVVMKAGIIGALVGFAIATYMTWRTVNYLTECGMQHEIFDYSSLAKHAFGPAGETAIDVSISLGGLGSVVSYVVVVGGVLSDLFHAWGCNSQICDPIPIILFSVAVFVAPLCLYRHFGHLTILAIFSIGAIWTVLFLVLIGGSFYQEPTNNNVNYFDSAGMLSSLGSMILALSICTGNFQAFASTEKKSQNIHDWQQVTAGAIGFGSCMCLCMGIAGYLYFRDETDGVIISNFTAPGFDFFKIMIVVHLICYIPASFVIMRYSMVKLAMNGQISEKLPPILHTVISLGLVALITSIVVMLQALGLSSGEAFSLVLDLTGGVAGSLVSVGIYVCMCIYVCMLFLVLFVMY